MYEQNLKDKQMELWKQQLRHPDWYIRLEDYLRSTIFPVVHDNPELKIERHRFYELVEEMLQNDEIPLAETGPDLDSERRLIDTIVIHHTEEEPDIRLSKLSAIGFVRQYGKAYLENNVWGSKNLKGYPIWSGHFRGDNMVFYAYHWLVRPNGDIDRLLEDNQIGWQSHDLNPQSVGLAFSGNYEHSTPPPEQIKAAAQVIRNHYSYIEISQILGHLEAMPDRTCPGDKFLSGWKKDLLSFVKRG